MTANLAGERQTKRFRSPGQAFRDRLERYFRPSEDVVTSPRVADQVTYTTCHMCACRCGIKVHLLDGRIRYIEGNKRHPVNRA